VIDKDAPKNGRGILPEVEALPQTNYLRREVDFKMEKVKALVKEAGNATTY
jgi:hypothetical protein